MRIFRVEHKHTLTGPFQRGDTWELTERAHAAGLVDDRWSSYHDRFPSPGGERLPRTYDHVCGIQSAALFNEWFPPCMHEFLNANKYELVVYEVPADDVAVGKAQVVFKRHNATVVYCGPVAEATEDMICPSTEQNAVITPLME